MRLLRQHTIDRCPAPYSQSKAIVVGRFTVTVRRASAVFGLSSAFGRPMCCRRARRFRPGSVVALWVVAAMSVAGGDRSVRGVVPDRAEDRLHADIAGQQHRDQWNINPLGVYVG